MAISFKTAVSRAKALYKSGRFKKFSDAVKAAYKQGGGTLVRQSGKSNVSADKKRKAKKPGKRKSASGRVYYEYRKNRTDKKGSLTGIREEHKTPLAIAKHKLAKALLDYDLADTIKATKEAAKRKSKYRKVVKSLMK